MKNICVCVHKEKLLTLANSCNFVLARMPIGRHQVFSVCVYVSMVTIPSHLTHSCMRQLALALNTSVTSLFPSWPVYMVHSYWTSHLWPVAERFEKCQLQNINK